MQRVKILYKEGTLLVLYFFCMSLITREMVPIKKRAGVIPYIFSSSLALLSSLLSYSFYLLVQKIISGLDLLEIT